jgi:predicted short-subunit dehydrogenase-like oxidoreductase (DUF2520 family)
VSGEPAARALARRWVAALEGHAVEVPAARRPRAHAAAILASNGVAAVLSAAVDTLRAAGVDADVARRALGPLLRGTVSEIEREGLAGGLSGPLARGDAEAVHLHLRALEGDARELYRLAGRMWVEAAEAEGRGEELRDAFETLLQLRDRT